MEYPSSPVPSPVPAEETPTQKQARLRRERREAKIMAGGSARLDKITSLSGRPAEAGELIPVTSEQPRPRRPSLLTDGHLTRISHHLPEPTDLERRPCLLRRRVNGRIPRPRRPRGSRHQPAPLHARRLRHASVGAGANGCRAPVPTAAADDGGGEQRGRRGGHAG